MGESTAKVKAKKAVETWCREVGVKKCSNFPCLMMMEWDPVGLGDYAKEAMVFRNGKTSWDFGYLAKTKW